MAITYTIHGTGTQLDGQTFSGGIVTERTGELCVDFGTAKVGKKTVNLLVRTAGKPDLQALANAELKKAADADAEAAERESKELSDIREGRTPITLTYHDGEYLSGYTIFGKSAKLLAELGLGKEVSGWGFHVSAAAVAALGETFTYQQAEEFARPTIEKKVAEESAAKATSDLKISNAIAEARNTGLPVVVESWVTDRCMNGNDRDCSFDTAERTVDGSGKFKTMFRCCH